MKKLLIISCLFLSLESYGNVNHFSIKLDEFTLFKSDQPIRDTIEVTRKAWIAADSVHLYAYICGDSQYDKKTTFTARSEENRLFQVDYVNHDLGYEFSFPTKRVDPHIVNFLVMTLAADKSYQKYGWTYRIGILKFI